MSSHDSGRTLSNKVYKSTSSYPTQAAMNVQTRRRLTQTLCINIEGSRRYIQTHMHDRQAANVLTVTAAPYCMISGCTLLQTPHHPMFYMQDALPDAQPTVSKN